VRGGAAAGRDDRSHGSADRVGTLPGAVHWFHRVSLFGLGLKTTICFASQPKIKTTVCLRQSENRTDRRFLGRRAWWVRAIQGAPRDGDKQA